MSIAGRLGAVYFTRSQQFHQAPHSGCSFLSSPLTKVTQGLQQCRPSYCIAYHSKPLDAAPWSAARGLFAEKCKIRRRKWKNGNSIIQSRKNVDEFWLKFWDWRTVQRSALCRSRRELSNEDLLAKIGFVTAENEPLKVRITDHTFDHIPSVL